jgi:ATP-dependent DNA ligase
VFDPLHLNGWDLRALLLVERKAKLEALLGQQGKAVSVRYSECAWQGPAFSRCTFSARAS